MAVATVAAVVVEVPSSWPQGRFSFFARPFYFYSPRRIQAFQVLTFVFIIFNFPFSASSCFIWSSSLFFTFVLVSFTQCFSLTFVFLLRLLGISYVPVFPLSLLRLSRSYFFRFSSSILSTILLVFCYFHYCTSWQRFPLLLYLTFLC